MPTPPPGSFTPDILWWKMNDGSGTTVTATVGPNGTTDADWITGKSGAGFALDFIPANSDNATSAGPTYGTNIITVAMWSWLDVTNSTMIIAESGTDPSTTNHTWIIYCTVGTIRVFIHGTGAATLSREESTPAANTGAWNHYLFVIDNSTTAGDVKIYLNGTLRSETITDNDKAGAGSFSSQPLNVAARNNASLFMDGRMDDLRIYSGDQSANVSAIMNDPQ